MIEGEPRRPRGRGEMQNDEIVRGLPINAGCNVSARQRRARSDDPMASKAPSVVIVGAGAAGITAAYTLLRSGVVSQVTILEASSRPGGRLRTFPHTGQEEGAEEVVGDNNKYWSDGYRDHQDWVLALGAEWIHVHPRILHDLVDQKEDARLTRQIDQFIQQETVHYKLDPYSEWNGRRWVRAKYEEETDYKFLNRRTSSWWYFFQQFILPTVQNHIVLNCVVKQIDYSTSHAGTDKPYVSISTSHGVHVADACIVTVPLTILKQSDIDFQPPLSTEVRQALDQATMPPGFKVFLEFREKFYHDKAGFGFSSDEKVQYGERYVYDAAFGRDRSSPASSTVARHILVYFAVGQPAEPFITLSDDELVRKILQALDQMFEGQASRHYQRHVVQNWAQEPFIRGSYSDYSRGYAAPIRILRQPLDPSGRIFLAGEHIPRHNMEFGFAHEAARSGRAAARMILDWARTSRLGKR